MKCCCCNGTGVINSEEYKGECEHCNGTGTEIGTSSDEPEDAED